MNLLDPREARHYCKGFRPLAGRSEASLKAYTDQKTGSLPAANVLVEGTPEFNEFRACLLRNTERTLFLAASNYRRAFDLMTVSASSWAHVTLYYGTFYAASSLLGLFGAWINAGRCRVDVSKSTPGSQELRIQRTNWGTYHGSHERFWDLFYQATIPVIPLVDPKEAFVLRPVAGNRTWLSAMRNEINYDSSSALVLSSGFKRVRVTRFPATLPPPLNTQFEVLEGLVLIACRFAKHVGLETDALKSISASGGLRSTIRALVYDAPPLKCRIRAKGLAH
jgi:hypothetical protein